MSSSHVSMPRHNQKAHRNKKRYHDFLPSSAHDARLPMLSYYQRYTSSFSTKTP